MHQPSKESATQAGKATSSVRLAFWEKHVLAYNIKLGRTASASLSSNCSCSDINSFGSWRYRENFARIQVASSV